MLHADADEPFVRGYLVPALGLAADRVALIGDLDLGEVKVEEIARRVRASRVTVVVLSPAYLTDRWAMFGEQLAASARIAQADGRRLLPLLRADCNVPDDIAALVGLDFRDARRECWREQAVRLRAVLDRPAPLDE
ncbi:MAG TPA: toll/interleukin-1 receptor domain-containing protein, partial [Kofleriaceae bacterium]|nr:toll/interleukin-1 receptor domain-containing protein [Kofleriaceae bacterium]